jgi:hypothetical protein
MSALSTATILFVPTSHIMRAIPFWPDNRPRCVKHGSAGGLEHCPHVDPAFPLCSLRATGASTRNAENTRPVAADVFIVRSRKSTDALTFRLRRGGGAPDVPEYPLPSRPPSPAYGREASTTRGRTQWPCAYMSIIVEARSATIE